jgi:ADP-ribose pyrophosphatase YjhB (NUDIX family)
MSYLEPRPDGGWPAVPSTITKRCDNTSVGVLIYNQQGRLLLFRRQDAPLGIAPPAGHIDQHENAEQAAIATVRREVGLTVTALRPLATTHWLPNVCGRQHGARGPGHNWSVYNGATIGELALAEQEADDPVWYTPTEVARLAQRTLHYGRGGIPELQWAVEPGLEPVWCRLLTDISVLDFTKGELAVAGQLYTRSLFRPGFDGDIETWEKIRLCRHRRSTTMSCVNGRPGWPSRPAGIRRPRSGRSGGSRGRSGFIRRRCGPG